jgi:hypothetical protein
MVAALVNAVARVRGWLRRHRTLATLFVIAHTHQPETPRAAHRSLRHRSGNGAAWSP